ncbi:unnamed protein product [Closterium sp. Yama58-4]|nr:unnamed protein product [Closterium sp. Yama58-4]
MHISVVHSFNTIVLPCAARSIANNHFSGSFPEPLLELTSLVLMDLSNNRFSGSIPKRLTKLVQLIDINLNNNKFHGKISPRLFQLSMLDSLQVANNFLSGGLPASLRASSSLKTLSLPGNGFTGPLPDFSLWSVSLENLALNHNNFTGSIPDSISTLSSLKAIVLNNNQLTGSISSAIFNMTNLFSLYLANNRLTGSLPAAISRLEKLEQLWLDNNSIEGLVPPAICSPGRLWRIMMSKNYLYGPLPECIFDKCVNQLDVSNNSLYGRINRNFKSMVVDDGALINLAHNFFFGDAVLFAAGCQVCPTEITEPNNLVLGDLSSGRAAGKCVDGISGTRDYSVEGAGKGARVSVAGNCLTVSADAECSANATQRSTAACQAFCSITDNGPCDGHGECVLPAPTFPFNFTCLCRAGYSALDSANGSTCAVVKTGSSVSSLSTGAIVGIAVGCFGGFVLLAAVLTCLLRPRGPTGTFTTHLPFHNLCVHAGKWEGLDVCEQYTLQQMVKATDNWAKENVLGKGAFGVVFKGYSPQGQTWAIKRSTVMTNDFEMEDQNVETGKQEQILVYEFVDNRDLQHHIYKSENPLSLRQRLRVAQGAAEGLAYLHGFATPIIHRDIKPANILVTADMHAKVADFGLLKRLTHGEDNQTRVAGTPGYVDPDYNRTRVVTTKSDVFSFGIVLLALVTGKPPRVEETHIRTWATKMVEDYQVIGMKDSKLDATEEAVLAIVDLALDCIKSPGARRPDMKDIAYRLTALMDKHCSDKEEVMEDASKEVKEIPSDSSAGTGTISQTSTMSLGSFMNGMGSWLEKRPS